MARKVERDPKKRKVGLLMDIIISTDVCVLTDTGGRLPREVASRRVENQDALPGEEEKVRQMQ